jgi:hypothetical protein
MEPIRSDLESGSYEAALQRFREESPIDSSGKDRLLFLMEKGNLMRLAGRYEAAEELLLEADLLSDVQRGTSVGEEAGALLTSDASRPFRGADYESVFINYCLASCFAAQGRVEDALVECRRLTEKLNVFNQSYKKDNRYRDDALARYLTGALYEASGDLDDALVAYRNSLRVYEEGYYDTPTPDQVVSDVQRLCLFLGFLDLYEEYGSAFPEVRFDPQDVPDGGADLVIVVEEGLIPPKRSREYTSFGRHRIYRVSLPAIPRTPMPPRSFRVRAESGHAASCWLAENVAAIARKNLEDHAARDIARAVGRFMVKGIVSGVGEEIVEELSGEEDGVWSEATGTLLSIVGAATEQADLRAWSTLPRRIYVARLSLPPGDHVVRVTESGRAVSDSIRVDLERNEVRVVFATVF